VSRVEELSSLASLDDSDMFSSSQTDGALGTQSNSLALDLSSCSTLSTSSTKRKLIAESNEKVGKKFYYSKSLMYVLSCVVTEHIVPLSKILQSYGHTEVFNGCKQPTKYSLVS